MMRIGRRKELLAGLLLLLVIMAPIARGAVPTKTYQVFLGNENKEEKEIFDCQEKEIFVYIAGIPPGSHTLEGFWYNPTGKQQEYTKYSFISRGERGELVWLWLRLHTGTGGELFGGLGLGIGMRDFEGKWRVTIYLDGKKISQKVFLIFC